MITETQYYGDANVIAMNADRDLIPGEYRLYVLTPSTSGLAAILPDAQKMSTGAVSFYVVNFGPDSIDLKDDGGTALATIADDQIAIIGLYDNATADGSWSIILLDQIT